MSIFDVTRETLRLMKKRGLVVSDGYNVYQAGKGLAVWYQKHLSRLETNKKISQSWERKGDKNDNKTI